jgi:N-acetylmuramoyl-L-alanine amidase
VRRSAIAILLLAALGGAALFSTRALWAADTDFAIHFEGSVLPLKSKSVNRVIYLPLVEIAQHLSQPYTDDFRLETFTIGAQNARLVTTRNSALISVNGQVVLLQNPVRRDDSQWFVPVDFLSQGMSRITGIEFRYRAGASRVFAGNVSPTELSLSAQAVSGATRLTLRAGSPVQVEIQRDATQRTVILLRGRPIDPLRERLDYKDRLVESVAFDDSDGIPKVLVATTPEAKEVRITAGDESRVYFVDFTREVAATEAAPPPPPPDIGAGAGAGARRIRLAVIDAGHGGDDAGVSDSGTLEKEWTLAVARKLRSALQNRLGATVLLTRDADEALTSEARAGLANRNQADLFISLHAGYSANENDAVSSIYVIQDGFGSALNPDVEPRDRLFLPWYLAHRNSRPHSEQLATLLQDQMGKSLPEWKFAIRTGPIAVLASTMMPAIAIEFGNLNNPANAQSLTDEAFQTQLAAAIAAAAERFAMEQGTIR